MKSFAHPWLTPLAVFAAAGSVHAALTPVERFNALNPGGIGGQNGWVVTAGDTTTSTVAVDPDDSANQILRHTGINDAYKMLPTPIANGATGTMFYRVRRTSATNDISLGLSDQSPPSLTDFSTFEAQTFVIGEAFGARDGGVTLPVANRPALLADVWYKIWVVANNSADTYRVFMQSDGDAAFATQTELMAPDGTWNFRNGVAANPLQAFAMLCNGAGTDLYVDDLYVDPAAQDLSDPTADTDNDDLDDGWELFHFGDLTTATGNGNGGGSLDNDSDGLPNVDEQSEGTNPTVGDSDSDGINDGDEVSGDLNPFFNVPTDPLDPDSDADGLSDGDEINGTLNPIGPNDPTDPLFEDTDFDGFTDPDEFLYGTDANDVSDFPSLHELIGLEKRNGSFEFRSGVAVGTDFKQGWDAADPNNIDAWTTWAGKTTVSNDSGVEAGGQTHGAVHAFTQAGNGAKNMSAYVAQEGDVLRLTYNRVNGYATGNTALIFDASHVSLGFIEIPGTAQNGTSDGSYTITYEVPSDSPAIGRPIGVGIHNTVSGTWPGWDEVVLTVQDRDSDDDGLSDFDEDRYWGNNDDNPTTGELAVTTGAADSDNDTFSNAAEIAGGSDPTDPNSFPADSDADGLDDDWEMTNFGNLDFDGTDDPDGDFATNAEEFAADTAGSDATDWPDSDTDGMNDAWETLHGLNTTFNDSAANPDGDGFTNKQEHDAGSDPNDAAWSPARPQLIHRWSFNGDLTDSVGGSDATIVEVGANDVTQNPDNITLAGGAKASSDYVSLGSNLLQGKMTPVSLELWATQLSVHNWSRVFSFNNGTTTDALFMSWTQGTNINSDRIGWATATSTLVNNTNAPYALGTEYHIVVTLTPAVNTLNDPFPLETGTRVRWRVAPAGDTTGIFYAQGSFDTDRSLATFNDVNNWLGQSIFADETANASYNEVRIYDGALTGAAAQVNTVAGPQNADALVDADLDGLYDAWEVHFFGAANTQNGTSQAGDADGVNLGNEQLGGSDPTNSDSVPDDIDGDDLPDEDFEMFYFGSLSNPNGAPGADPDADFDTNLVEAANGTNPTDKTSFFSSTGDTVPDSWLAFYGITSQDGTDDLDEGSGDDLDNTGEFTAGTNPTLVDTDSDGLPDGAEVNDHFTDPLVADSDGDGLNDGDEVNTHGSDPLIIDSDGDGFGDGYEVTNGSDPADAGSTPPQTAGWSLIEDFEGSGMVVGQTFNGVNGWTTTGTATVVNDPAGGDQAGSWVTGNMRKSLSALQLHLLNGNTGTLFFQVRTDTTTTMDKTWGLSDVATPTGTGDFEAQMGYNNGNVNVRNAGGNISGFQYPLGEWSNVWMVIHNDTDTVDVYMETPLGQSGVVQIASGASFRNGVATNPLLTLWFMKFNGDVAMLFDNIYFDPTSQNLANPLSSAGDSDGDGIDDQWELDHFGDLDQDATTDFDADGTPDVTEFRLGLDPTDPSSRFLLTTSDENPGDGFTFSWPSQPGTTFTVRRYLDLQTVDLEVTGISADAGSSTTYTDATAPAGKAFYTVELE